MDILGTFLIVEDNKTMSTNMEGLVKAFWKKFMPIIAENGYEAIQKVEQNEPALIFMDLKMPRIDGFEAIRILRSKGYKMPIIVVSALKAYNDVLKAIHCGCDDYVVKPIDTNLLNDKIGHVLAKKGNYHYPAFPFKDFRIINLSEKFDIMRLTKTFARQIEKKQADLILDAAKARDIYPIIDYIKELPADLDVSSVRVVLRRRHAKRYINNSQNDLGPLHEKIYFYSDLNDAVGDKTVKLHYKDGRYSLEMLMKTADEDDDE